ncbi:rhomboid-like protein [Amycolatopsis pigmentata]|uniref:Rhomboid-like protein n=1 Tax=Amycolatopsis pigmentata TaxID=450801 RepID=A0ABW5G6U8_9PSEU
MREEAATTRRRHRWVIRAGRLLPTPTGTPFTFCYLVVLLVTSNIQRLAGAKIAARLLAVSSTDADNLVHHPINSLISSALWLGSKDWLVYAVIFAVAVAPLERRIGSGWTFAIFASGHVLATLATEVPMIVALQAGLLPHEAGQWLDVGVSYGFFATAGAMAIVLVPKQRGWAVAAIDLFIAVIYVTDAPATLPAGLTFAGHLIAAHIGMLGWLTWLRRHGYAGTARIGRVREEPGAGEVRPTAALAAPPAP